MTDLVVVRGLPGSGKSTFARKLIKSGFTLIESDMHHVEHTTREYVFSEKEATNAYAWADKTIFSLLADGQDVVTTGVYPRNVTLQKMHEKCRAMGVGFTVVTAEASYGSVHDVPEEVYKDMKLHWQPLNL